MHSQFEALVAFGVRVLGVVAKTHSTIPPQVRYPEKDFSVWLP